ncbi:hypothetical protein [Solimicrobium silvestre]|uniref:Uncharacterized protein n=1 Tax=Solimicrobium silvestre TaxID=2099400 RepID=A0A2S9GTD3_9BURK|nr:hypothetical protein [Solimicrobium silvestre]PRC90979.1 hypothetical protein S2091_4275 [Solimicrobium silvestre]
MEIKTVISCPLGSKCEEIRGDALHRCAWFIQLAGTNPNTGDAVDERGCAMSWVPILLIENSQQQRSTNAAVESFRNEVVNASNASQHLFAVAAGIPTLINT